jgi:hypothetical protein
MKKKEMTFVHELLSDKDHSINSQLRRIQQLMVEIEQIKKFRPRCRIDEEELNDVPCNQCYQKERCPYKTQEENQHE